jgi:hypothetical protein
LEADFTFGWQEEIPRTLKVIYDRALVRESPLELGSLVPETSLTKVGTGPGCWGLARFLFWCVAMGGGIVLLVRFFVFRLLPHLPGEPPFALHLVHYKRCSLLPAS